MVDEDDPSYKQEQMPMYETRQVLLMRSGIMVLTLLLWDYLPGGINGHGA